MKRKRSASDPHAPLREDVRMLGAYLGETIREQAGTGLFETVEEIRALSKKVRRGQEENLERLSELLGGLQKGELSVITRAFELFLNLATIAEQHHRIRRRH